MNTALGHIYTFEIFQILINGGVVINGLGCSKRQKLINDPPPPFIRHRRVNGFDSETKNVNCGLPQGSSLGPLLFLIYINDFRLCLNKTETGHFADDTYILYGSKRIGSIESVVNYELKLVSKWLRLNKLSLNTGKTELIFFHSKQHTINYNDISIKFNGIKLLPVDKVEYLGMIIDKYLSWNYHVQQLRGESHIGFVTLSVVPTLGGGGWSKTATLKM